METPGRIAATPDALDFTVENVETVSFCISQLKRKSRDCVKDNTGELRGEAGRLSAPYSPL